MECDQIIQVTQTNRDWVVILSALLTPTIAILGSAIAILQWRTNSARLKHELFERRYQQFEVIRDFLHSIVSNGKVKTEEEYKFISGTRGSRFLFDKDISEYISKTIRNLSIELQTLETEYDASRTNEDKVKNKKKQRIIKDRLYNEVKCLEEKFSGYLQLKH